MITSENLLLHEIIGLNVEIVESTNNQILGISGMVIDETKSMFVLHTKKGVKKIPKKNSTWKFFVPNSTVVLSGELLNKRPHERLALKA
ncbi:MAG: ribonuclease P protein component 1 [Nitrosopumilaceae archaeon]